MPTCKSPFDEIKEAYQRCPQLSIEQDLQYFLVNGYVFSGPNYFLMGRRIGLGWHIHAAAGRGAIKKFVDLMPYYLPFVGWARCGRNREETIWYPTETIIRRLNMKLTPEQEFEKCRFAAANLVAQYREHAPAGFDPVALGGGVPKAPKPPAPPTANQASSALLTQGKKRKPAGYQSTILTGQTGGSPQGTTSILGD